MIRISSPSHPAANSARVCPQRLAGARLLLAEDCPDHQRLFALILRHEGADVEIVDNGQAAVELALAAQELGTPFDVLLMDMQLPTLSGYAATRALRALSYDRPIAALTARALISERQECFDCGCDEYVSKPVESEKLIATLVRLRNRDHAARPGIPLTVSLPCPQGAPTAP